MDWVRKTKDVKVGDVVAYSRTFLQSIACYTDDMPAARGKVTALRPVGTETTLAEIDWDLPDLPARVNVKNLIRANDIKYDI
jgi:hypothetical protein